MRHTEQQPANETCAIAVCRPGTFNIHPAAEKKKKKTRLSYMACSSFFDSRALRPHQKVDGNAHNDSRLFPLSAGCLDVEKTSKADAILCSRLSSAAAGAFV
jgi:hypothetical protein